MSQVFFSEVVVDVSLSSDEYRAYYAREATDIVGRALDGRMVRFPAGILQKFLLHDGIHGRFSIKFNESGKLVEVSRIAI